MEPKELVALVKQGGLDAIEWGSNVHVPAGDLKTADEVRQMTEQAGLGVSSYGSYWKIVDAEGRPDSFNPYLESAQALGTDTIRIWAGHKPSDAVTAAERKCMIDQLREALDAAQRQGIKLGLEFHANTLSDSNASTLELLDELNHPQLFTYWQPIYWLTDPQYRLDGLRQLADRVLNLHVFHWLFRPGAGSWGESTDRRTLEEGANDWETYFSVPLRPSLDHYALLEFVRGDEPGQFLRDAASLKTILKKEHQ
jgi:sugar phosphate isomerase/epimerase